MKEEGEKEVDKHLELVKVVRSLIQIRISILKRSIT